MIESILTQSWKNFVGQVKMKILAKEKLTIENFLQNPQVKILMNIKRNSLLNIKSYWLIIMAIQPRYIFQQRY